MEGRKALPRQVGRVLLAFVASILFTVLTALPASASTSAKASVGGTSLCPTSNATGNSQSAASNYLPANRWLGALGTTHTDLALGFNIGNDIAYAQRSGLISPLMSIGDVEWGLGISATEFANNFCISSSVGNAINKASAGFDKALQQGDIVVIIIIVALLALLIKHARGRGQGLLGSILRIAVVIAIFSIMLSASANQQPNAPPKFGSPSWLLNTIYGAVNSITAAPTQAMAAAVNQIGVNGGGQALSDPLNCYYYNEVLVDTYAGAKGGIPASQGGSAGVGPSYAAVPVALNTLWEGLAVPTYINEQFGSNNNFGPLMYCHLLEQNANIRPRYQAQIQSAAIKLSTYPSLAGSYNSNTGTVSGGILGGTASSSASALAWNGAITTQTQDESMVGWAACQTNSTSDTPMEWDVQGGGTISPSEWTVVGNTVTPGSTGAYATDPTNGKPVVAPKDCQAFFQSPVNGTNASGAWALSTSAQNPDYSPFDWWAATPANISNAITSKAIGSPSPLPNGAQFGTGIVDFLNNLHGTSNTGAEASAMIFVFSSTIVMAVFFLLSIALLISKVALLFLLLMLPIMLLVMLLPFANSEGKFLMMAKKTLSLIVFSTSVGLILSFIAGMSAMLSSVGAFIAGPGSIFSLIFIGVSPLVAIYIIHMFFKKVIKAPSPFKPSGMMGYAASAGTLGAIGGAEIESRWNKAHGAAKGYVKKRLMSGSDSSSGGRGFGRRGGMSNADGEGKSKMGAGSGADENDPNFATEHTSTVIRPDGTVFTQSHKRTPHSGPEAAVAANPAATPKERASGAAAGFAATAAVAAEGAAGGAGSPIATETPHTPRTPRETARSAVGKLARGAKYVAPHPLEGMRGKSVVGKVAHVAKKSVKYTAIGSVALAATPAMAGVATLGTLAAGAVAAGAVSRKMHLRRHPEFQRAQRDGTNITPTNEASSENPVVPGESTPTGEPPTENTDPANEMPHKSHNGRETKFVLVGNVAKEVYVDDGTPVERMRHWTPRVETTTASPKPTRTFWVAENGQTTERSVAVDEAPTARLHVREPYKPSVRDITNPSPRNE